MTMCIGGKIEYFLSSQSGRGFITYLKDALRFCKKQITLQGGTSQIRSKIIRNAGLELMDRGLDIEIARGILNPDNLEGIIIPQLNYALISGSPKWENNYNSKVINLDQYRDVENYLVYKGKIKDIYEQINVNLELLQEELGQLRQLFFEKCSEGSELEERQALYITEKLLRSLFTLDEGKMNHRFGQVLTSRGVVNLFPKLLADCSTKYYVNDIQYLNAGSMLKLVAREAVLKGLVVSVYHNFLEPELVELIILEEMNLAIGIRPFTPGFQKLVTYEGSPLDSGFDFYLENLDFANALKWLQEIEKLYDQCSGYYHETLNSTELINLEKDLLTEIIGE